MNTFTKITAAALATAMAAPATAADIVETGAGFAIEDNTAATSDIVVTANAIIQSLTVTLDIEHTYLGDLIISLSNGANTVIMLDRPGVPPGAFGNGDNLNGVYTFDDSAADFFSESSGLGDIPSGSFLPQAALADFDGANTAGTWTLSISDNAGGDLGTLNSWSLNFTTATGAVPEPGTWLMMILGFGLIGASMRAKSGKLASTKVSYS